MFKSKFVNGMIAQVKIDDLLAILGEFGPLPADLHANLADTNDPDAPRHWVVLAARAESIDYFRQSAVV